MRVGIDATYALDRHPSGVARYSDRLIRELARLPQLDLTLCARWPRWLRLRRHFQGARFRASLLQEPLNVVLPRRVDLFHGLNQRLPRYRFRRQVVTVHDIFAVSGAEYSTAAFQARFSEMLADAVARADRVICVSAWTRDRLCERLNVRPERCVVIHHGVDQEPAPPSAADRQRARRLAGDGPFFLSVGAVQVRKNNLAAARAVARLGGGARLIVAGSAGHGAEQFREAIRRENLAHCVRVLGYVEERTLNALYTEATALLFPSLEEGFGMPVLEAMARGVPVIASNAASLPEVVGDAAILTDPNDVEAMAEAARRLLEHAAWRAEWAARGRARARLFTWPAVAQATLEVYKLLL